MMSASITQPCESVRVAVARWCERERALLPAERDRRLIEGLDGERYLFDTPSGLFVQVFGPANALMGVLFAGSEATGARLEEAAAGFSVEELTEAMQECALVLDALREQRRPAAPLEKSRPGYNLSLNAGMACNFSCTYCDPLGYREKTRGQVMSEETAQQALDFFFERVPEGEFGNVTFSIGGEPLLYRKLMEFVEEYVAALRGQGIGAGQYLNTNGMLLTDGAIEYLRVHRIPFGISLDGPREAHDAGRVLPDGRPTYDRVLPAARKALTRCPDVSASAVITAAFPHPVEIYRHLLEFGFQRIIVKPVRGQPDQPFAFTLENLPLLEEGYREYARYLAAELISGRRAIYAAINPHDYFGVFLIRVLRRHKNNYRCGAASMANLAVAPDASFYPCEGFVGQTEHRLGDVEAGLDETALARFADLFVDNRPVCHECWARYLCGGGCYLQGLVVTGNVAGIEPVDCKLTRFIAELAVWTLGRVETERPEALAELNEWCASEGWSRGQPREAPPPRSDWLELPVVA